MPGLGRHAAWGVLPRGLHAAVGVRMNVIVL